MEQIKQAVERAKTGAHGEQLRPVGLPEHAQSAPPAAAPLSEPRATARAAAAGTYRKIQLNWSHLEQRRIVGHNVADSRSKAFDMLRTQVLQAMDQKNWQFLAVTSPTEGCGKTVTAINLALSIGRQRDRSALLIDMDLQRPAVADTLGIKCRGGVQALLERRATLTDAVIRAQADSCELMVLPAEAPTVRSSELIGSRDMDAMLQDVKQVFKHQIVVLDMPPLLQGDEVLAMLPRIDCVLLVTAVGVTTLHEVRECNRHLQASEVIRIVLNKSNETTRRYYY